MAEYTEWMNTMDVREKLVELLAPTSLNFEESAYLADYLVKNGVTIQEWVSVDDRLPGPKEKTICVNRDGDIMIGIYTGWGWMFPCYFEEPTHWMPLPQPPKGE